MSSIVYSSIYNNIIISLFIYFYLFILDSFIRSFVRSLSVKQTSVTNQNIRMSVCTLAPIRKRSRTIFRSKNGFLKNITNNFWNR